MPWLFLLASLVGAWCTYNVYRPRYAPPRLAVPSFFAGWLTGELPLHHLAWQVLATLLFVAAGALRGWAGVLGLGITVGSWCGLWGCWRRAGEAAGVAERALHAALGVDYRERILPAQRALFPAGVDWRSVALPFPLRHPDVERTRDLMYARVAGLNLRLDVYRHRAHPRGCPTLLQIHGGGWVIGSKNEQALPLMLHLAARGWVCVSADYRLSPHATFPDHLVDLKRALHWLRVHAAEYGADPSFVVVTGGSAGGHLAALMALTANQPAYQPGFEDADTSVQGCVPFYGVYDFTNRHHFWHHDALVEFLEQRVMKASRAEAPAAYEQASPLSCVHAGAPPFFVIHGDRDTLAPVEEARCFAEAMRRVSQAPVAYAQIPGAQHAFEIFPSRRALLVIEGVERFLAYLYSRHVQAHSPAAAEPPALSAAG